MAFEALLGGDADAAHAAHGKRIEKRALGARVDDGEAARLVHIGGDLRNRLGGSHAYRARDAELLDPLLDAPRHGNGVLPVGSRGGDVEEGLVDADLLHERRLVVQDGHNLVADLLIPIEPARGPDGLRAELLESKGYETQLLEFIDMEHTPKNILIRAVKTGKKKNRESFADSMKALHVNPTLDRLLYPEESISQKGE